MERFPILLPSVFLLSVLSAPNSVVGAAGVSEESRIGIADVHGRVPLEDEVNGAPSLKKDSIAFLSPFSEAADLSKNAASGPDDHPMGHRKLDESCLDDPDGWVLDFSSDFDCAWFAIDAQWSSEVKCETWGVGPDWNGTDGKTAQQACCACGGGIKISAAPSESPTGRPTLFPSQIPSSFPSIAPTEKPSISPSYIPSDVPSMAPSGSPSTTPSIPPSFIPSNGPSSIPSFIPSESPSISSSAIPSNGPSSPPALSPVIPRSFTSLPYKHVVFFDDDDDAEAITSIIEKAVNSSLVTLLQDESSVFHQFMNLHGLIFDVDARVPTINEGCSATDLADMHCALFTTDVTASHFENITYGEVRYEMLVIETSLTESINSALAQNGYQPAIYMGPKPISVSDQVRLLGNFSGVPNEEEIHYFEDTWFPFLNESFSKADPPVVLLYVKVVNVTMTLDATAWYESLQNQHRRSRRMSSSGLEFDTVITGEYQGPYPDAGLNDLMEDSINSEFIDVLEDSSFYEETDGVWIDSSSTPSPSPDALYARSEEEQSNSMSTGGVISIAAFCAFVAILLAAVAFLTFRRRRIRRDVPLSKVDGGDPDNSALWGTEVSPRRQSQHQQKTFPAVVDL